MDETKLRRQRRYLRGLVFAQFYSLNSSQLDAAYLEEIQLTCHGWNKYYQCNQ